MDSFGSIIFYFHNSENKKQYNPQFAEAALQFILKSYNKQINVGCWLHLAPISQTTCMEIFSSSLLYRFHPWRYAFYLILCSSSSRPINMCEKVTRRFFYPSRGPEDGAHGCWWWWWWHWRSVVWPPGEHLVGGPGEDCFPQFVPLFLGTTTYKNRRKNISSGRWFDCRAEVSAFFIWVYTVWLLCQLRDAED